MTDLEMTKLCAEAMGYEVIEPTEFYPNVTAVFDQQIQPYFPLHDDTQAMALVKKFELQATWRADLKEWLVIRYSEPFVMNGDTYATDLNRAIVECVAKMQVDRAESVNRGAATLNKSLYG